MPKMSRVPGSKTKNIGQPETKYYVVSKKSFPDSLTSFLVHPPIWSNNQTGKQSPDATGKLPLEFRALFQKKCYEETIGKDFSMLLFLQPATSATTEVWGPMTEVQIKGQVDVIILFIL